MGTNLKKA
jgi:hypothetical protein